MSANSMRPGDGLDFDNPNLELKQNGPVECFGKTFANDAERRAHYLAILADKLKNPEFRKIEGFPIGEDEDILELSDPPYYTACPNPFVEEFLAHYGRPYDPAEVYKREPYTADVSEGRNNPIYNAHSYHTKVPHRAIMRYILHFTKPGDVILDSFCGSGMAGVAAQLCGSTEEISGLDYIVDVGGNVLDSVSGEIVSEFGARVPVLNDLSPIATFLTHNFNKRSDFHKVQLELDNLLDLAVSKIGWMYSTNHHTSTVKDSLESLKKGDYSSAEKKAKGSINYVLWSDVFLCPECTFENVFWEAAVDPDKAKVNDKFNCRKCSVVVDKGKANKLTTTFYDAALQNTVQQAKTVPVSIGYTYDGKKYEKKPDEYDIQLIEECRLFDVKAWFPTDRMPEGKEGRRNDPSGLTNVHHFFTPRNLAWLAFCMGNAGHDRIKFILTSLMFKSSVLCSPLMSNYFAEKNGNSRGGWIGKERTGTLYSPSIHSEIPITVQLKTRRRSTSVELSNYGKSIVTTGSSSKLTMPDCSVDYAFIDPPFGSNIYYSELSFIWESWLKAYTSNGEEAIENSIQRKGPNEYRNLMHKCFKEIYRVLKPGRWVTIEFSNTKSYVWNNIQSALVDSGFIVSNVSALSKIQGSINAYTTTTAVKQDLVISAYKPDGGFEKRFVSQENEEGIWDFVRTHLGYLPVVKKELGELIKIRERDPRILFDQLVSYFIRANKDVTISSKEFQEELLERFAERDGMIFLLDQVTEYDKVRITSKQLKQLSIFVDDEASAIEWIRQLLSKKPQTYQDIHPKFINELSGWKKTEEQLELSKFLEQNFLKYEQGTPLPPQIHSYFSTNFRELRKLPKNSPILLKKAKDRWYVPNPAREEDLQKLRERDLLKQFAEYKNHESKKFKTVRLEAVRCGFKKAWQDRDYATIITVAEKIPQNLLQEDQKLLMWYDQAQTRHSDENLF